MRKIRNPMGELQFVVEHTQCASREWYRRFICVTVLGHVAVRGQTKHSTTTYI